MPPPRGRVLIPPMEKELPVPIHELETHRGYELVDLSAIENSDRVIAELKPVAGFSYPEQIPLGRVAVSGLPFHLTRGAIALSRSTPSVRIPIGRKATEVEFLGHVLFNSPAGPPAKPMPGLPFLMESSDVSQAQLMSGYPYSGAYKEPVAEYILNYEDGTRESIVLRNGVHFADYRLFYGLSHIDAIAIETERAIKYSADQDTKAFQLRLLSYRPKRPASLIRDIEFRLLDPKYVPLLAAVTVQNQPGPATDLGPHPEKAR